MSGFPLARLWWPLFPLALACSSSTPDVGDDDDVSGGQTGEEEYGCLPVRREPIALEATSSLGFSGADVLEALGARQTRTLTYEGGATTALELALAYASGSVELVEQEFRSDDSGRETASSGAEIAIECSDVLELELTLTFETDDGAFDEAWPVRLAADTASTARVFHAFDPDALSGTFRIERGSYDAVSANLSLNLVGMTWTGALDGQGEEQGDGASPDSVVSSTGIPIGTF